MTDFKQRFNDAMLANRNATGLDDIISTSKVIHSLLDEACERLNFLEAVAEQATRGHTIHEGPFCAVIRDGNIQVSNDVSRPELFAYLKEKNK